MMSLLIAITLLGEGELQAQENVSDENRWDCGKRGALHPCLWSPQIGFVREHIGLPRAWALGSEGRGKSATICIVDTGIDTTHEDFRDATGRTRIRWILDMGAAPRGVHPHLERYGGAVWSAEEVDLALARGEKVVVDRQGHGTAVASAAAGDGAATGSSSFGWFAGVAPEADLIVVDAFDDKAGGFWPMDVIRGVQFCTDPRVSQPERTVVLLALGGHDGAHDGSSQYEKALNELVSLGVAIVAASGNDGLLGIHARGAAFAFRPWYLEFHSPGSRRHASWIQLAIRGGHSFRFYLPNGMTTPIFEGDGVHSTNTVRIEVTKKNGWHSVRLTGELTAGTWAVEIWSQRDGGEMIDAWISGADLGEFGFYPRFIQPDPHHEVRIPATAEKVISVGAYSKGGEADVAGDEVERALFSSRGPRVDGLPIPTIVAPGGWVVVALSSDLDPSAKGAIVKGEQFHRLRRGEGRVAMAGTSISAAIVGGALALARGVAPGTRSDFSLLAATAAQLTDKVFDPRVGAGLLRVDRLAFLRAQPPEMGDLEHGCVFSQQSPSQWNVWLIVRSRGGGRGRIQIRSGDFSAGVWMMDGWGVALLPGFSKGNSVVERGGTSEGISPCTLFSV
ncbi:MAG: S8 family serine peptidase, partial [Sandaracinaceae bacterium]|nr:S8 family serine peptidase [Sandaracinaceae bacterium]